jgi:hypothetical protein
MLLKLFFVYALFEPHRTVQPGLMRARCEVSVASPDTTVVNERDSGDLDEQVAED